MCRSLGGRGGGGEEGRGEEGGGGGERGTGKGKGVSLIEVGKRIPGIKSMEKF